MLVISSISKLFSKYMRKENRVPNFLEGYNQIKFTYEVKKVKFISIYNNIILFIVVNCNFNSSCYTNIVMK